MGIINSQSVSTLDTNKLQHSCLSCNQVLHMHMHNVQIEGQSIHDYLDQHAENHYLTTKPNNGLSEYMVQTLDDL